MTRAAAAALLLASGLGCRKAEPPKPAPRRIVIAQLAAPVTLDPDASDNNHTSNALSHFYEALVGFTPEMELRPVLAERWESPSDTTWRFHLRPGVVFHDGRPFGAADVVASIKRALAPESHLRYYLEAVADVHALDDLTVELVTRHPAPVLLNDLVFIPMLPRDAGAETITHPLGTGPYSFVSGVPGGELRGHRFDRHWAPPAAFQDVTIVPIPDTQERAVAVATHRADVVTWFPSQYWAGARDKPGQRLLSRQGLAGVYLGFSLKRGSPFANPKARLAIALGVNRARIVRDAMNGLGAPLDQVVPPSVAGYSSSLVAIGHDAERSRALLKELGLNSGPPVPLYSADSNDEVAHDLYDQLQELGLPVKLQMLPQKEFYDRWTTEDLPLCLVGWSSATGDASGAFEPLLHSPTGRYGRFNRWGYANPRLDRLIEDSDQALAQEERREPLAQAAQIVQDDMPLIPLALRYDLYAVRPDLDFKPRLDRRVRAFDVHPVGAP
jgi:peptide/nickel transport system substrate-binding protein